MLDVDKFTRYESDKLKKWNLSDQDQYAWFSGIDQGLRFDQIDQRRL